MLKNEQRKHFGCSQSIETELTDGLARKMTKTIRKCQLMYDNKCLGVKRRRRNQSSEYAATKLLLFSYYCYYSGYDCSVEERTKTETAINNVDKTKSELQLATTTTHTHTHARDVKHTHLVFFFCFFRLSIAGRGEQPGRRVYMVKGMRYKKAFVWIFSKFLSLLSRQIKLLNYSINYTS